MKLNGSAGTGNKILKNWSLFSFDFVEKDVSDDGKIETYHFRFQFDKQKGQATIIRKMNDNKQWYIDQGTLFDSDSFPRPLGAYNDTASFTDGLYEVAEKMIQSL